MAILSFAGALVVLLIGALVLNFASQSLEGRKTVFLHFGWLTLVVGSGAALFPFWGWISTGWLLGGAALWSLVPPLWARLYGDGPPQGYMWHGDEPADGDDP